MTIRHEATEAGIGNAERGKSPSFSYLRNGPYRVWNLRAFLTGVGQVVNEAK
jgi:hypothetical protein